jgi:hypothetical protein
MKKIIWVLAILLTLVLAVVYRQLISCHGRQYPPKLAGPVTMQESMILGPLLIQ